MFYPKGVHIGNYLLLETINRQIWREAKRFTCVFFVDLESLWLGTK